MIKKTAKYLYKNRIKKHVYAFFLHKRAFSCGETGWFFRDGGRETDVKEKGKKNFVENEKIAKRNA